MAKGLGQLETRLFAYTQMRELSVVRTGELMQPLQISKLQERSLLSRLSREGMIARVWRGVYLVPPRLPLGGKWTPSDSLALGTLMECQNVRYQISGPNAFNRYGFDEQVPLRTYVYNDSLTGVRTIGTLVFEMIKVAPERLGSTEQVATADGVMAYSSRTRTLVDAVYDWSRFDSLPRAYEWIRRELKARRVDASGIVRDTLRYGNQGTIRRIGALLERLDTEEALLRKLGRSLRPSSSLIPWIPTYPKRGTVNRRWGLVINEQP